MNLTTFPNGKTIATIEGDTHIGKWAIESQRLDHDQNMLPLLKKYIPEGGVVVDVGAYIGDHTVFYAECVGQKGAVMALEPNPEAFECLKYNTKHLPSVYTFNIAASDKPGTIGLAKDTNAGATHASGEGEIECADIDSIGLRACHFMKFDCEGMEPQAIYGALQTIKAYRPTMLIEVNQSALKRQGTNAGAIFAILDSIGYRYRNIYLTQQMEGPQYDILCEPS
jgi:FkbM family methyltransferase